jgi:hypothetical protein
VSHSFLALLLLPLFLVRLCFLAYPFVPAIQ